MHVKGGCYYIMSYCIQLYGTFLFRTIDALRDYFLLFCFLFRTKEERLKKKSEDIPEVLAWVNRSRKLEEKRNAEKEKALQLSKIFEEQVSWILFTLHYHVSTVVDFKLTIHIVNFSGQCW